MVRVVEVVIHLEVQLPAVRSAQDDLVKVLNACWGVINCRLRIEIDDCLADRIDEIGIDQVGDSEVLTTPLLVEAERIEYLLLDRLAHSTALPRVGAENKRIAEIAAAFRLRRHEGVNCHGVLDANL